MNDANDDWQVLQRWLTEFITSPHWAHSGPAGLLEVEAFPWSCSVHYHCRNNSPSINKLRRLAIGQDSCKRSSQYRNLHHFQTQIMIDEAPSRILMSNWRHNMNSEYSDPRFPGTEGGTSVLRTIRRLNDLVLFFNSLRISIFSLLQVEIYS